jgi:peptidyl-prolyl cis-trans isomerase C
MKQETNNSLSRRKSIYVLMLALSGLLFLNACNKGDSSSKSVAVVNGKALSSEEVDFLGGVLAARSGGNRPSNDVVLKELIRLELLKQEADKEGLTTTASYKTRLDAISRNMAAEAEAENYFSKQVEVTESELRKIYDENIGNTRPKQFRARQIVTDDEQSAKDILVKLKEGSKFEDLAKTSSKDTSTRDKGGEIGWFSAGQTSPAVAKVLGDMVNGEITATPIHMQVGWHVIQLEDTRKVDPPTFDAVKEQLKAAVKQERLQKHASELEEKAKIVLTPPKAAPSEGGK